MLNLPAVRHTIAIGVRVRGVGGSVNVGQREVSGVGGFTFCTVTHVLHLHRVVAPERALFVEETVVLRTVPYAITVGVAHARVGGIVAFGREFDVAVFVKVGPQTLKVHVTGLVQIQTVGVIVKQRVPRIGWVQSVNNLPTVRHAIGVGIVGARVHELQVGIASWRRCAEDRDVTFVCRCCNGDDFSGQTRLVLKAVDCGVIACERPKTPLRTNQHLISGRMNGTDVVRLLGEFTVHSGVNVQPTVFNEIIVQVQLVQSGRGSKPQGLCVCGRRPVQYHGSNVRRVVV